MEQKINENLFVLNRNLAQENQFLLRFILIVSIVYVLLIGFSDSEREKIEKENAKLQQQVIDYKWQLEQVQYIMEYQRGE